MKTHAVRLLAVVLPAVLASAAAIAADPAPANPSTEEQPKVYTNADLERMFGPPTPSEPKKQSPEEAGRDQQFVEAFLEREHRQLQAEQEQALKRQAMEQQAPPVAQDSYGMGYAPYSGWWGGGWTGGANGGGGNHGRPKQTPYFSPYAPKPGQPGWNELVLSHMGGGTTNQGHGSGSQPKPHHGRGGR